MKGENNMEKLNKIMETLKKIKPHTYVSIVMVIIAIVNYVLTAMGEPIIDLGEETITYAVNTVLNLVFIGFSMWKNNSVTENALIADDVLYMLRDGKISKEELEKFIEEYQTREVAEETEGVKKVD